MTREVFIVRNVSTADIEIQDLGLIIISDASLDLGNYDQAILSDDLNFYLESGDLIRYIDGSSVSYDKAYEAPYQLADYPSYSYVDGSLNIKVNQTLFDSSILSLTNGQASQDASILLRLKEASLGPSFTWSAGLLDVSAGSSGVSKSYVDGSLAQRDSSIQWLVNNTYTKTYIDGSLNLKVNRTLFDSSILSLTNWQVSQDASLLLRPTFTYVDGSLNVKVNQSLFDSSILSLTNKNISQDSSIVSIRNTDLSQDSSIIALRTKDTNIDTSLNTIWTKVGYIDISLNNLGIKNSAQDASIVRIDGSINIIFAKNIAQDSSIVALRAKDASQDVSINGIWTKLGSVDTSLLNLGIKDANQDVSINALRIYTDGSLNNRVRITGDTMTGNLTVPGLKVTFDVSIGRKLHIDPCTFASPVNGDLWVEPSTYNLMYKHPITTFDGSSYDLTDRLLRTDNDWSSFPDSSTLDEGDRILIEDAQDGYKKKRISASAFAQSIGALNYASYAESLGVSSTTSGTLQTKLTMVTDASATADVYRIGWSFQLANSGSNKYTNYSIEIDSSVIESDTIRVGSSESYWQVAGFQHLGLSAGSHNVYIKYSAGSNTARIKYARLEFSTALAK
ncbi:MAG TPA: hypothetical protein PK122_01385 [Candidatus Paceibacterota bacterium]|nr:hypothetical protein [Candidatus Paceibacterota bacterium]